MKKSIMPALPLLLCITFASAQTSGGTVVTENLAALWKVLLGVILVVLNGIYGAAAWIFVLMPSQVNEVIFSIIILITLFIFIAKTMRDFTALSSFVAWIISFALSVMLIVSGVIKSIAVVFAVLISAIAGNYGIVLGIAIIALIFIIFTVIRRALSQSVKRQERERKRAKEEAGKKVFEKVGESMGGK